MLYGFTVRKGHEIIARFPWRIGIVAFMLFPELLKSDEGAGDKILTIANDPFFDLFEVAPMRDSEWAKLRDVAKEKEFALALQPEILVRGRNPNALSEDERREVVKLFVEEIRRAGERGMKAVALCSGPNVEGADREKAIEALVKTLRELAEEASRYGMPVYLETFDYQWDKKRLVGPIDLAAKVVERVRETHRNVYIMWDLSHGPLLNEDPEVLKSYPDLIGHIHVGCAKKVDDKLYDWHPGFYRPGALNTERELAKLLAVLHDIGYRGAVSFEIKPEGEQSPFEILNAAKGVLLRAFQLLLESGV